MKQEVSVSGQTSVQAVDMASPSLSAHALVTQAPYSELALTGME